jgi:hypothetical protein
VHKIRDERISKQYKIKDVKTEEDLRRDGLRMRNWNRLEYLNHKVKKRKKKKNVGERGM